MDTAREVHRPRDSPVGEREVMERYSELLALVTRPPVCTPLSPPPVWTGACMYHKQQSEVPGQLRDGTTRCVLPVPLRPEWYKRLSRCVRPVC